LNNPDQKYIIKESVESKPKLVPSPACPEFTESPALSLSKGGEVNKTLNIGIIGAGSFAFFATGAFRQIPGIHIIAVTDIDNSLAVKMAAENRAIAYDNIQTLLQDGNIDLVYIATPPYLHYRQSKMALLAGKHVICEKPAALKTIEAEELYILAKDNDLLYVVNLMQRYNPLYDVVASIIIDKVFGDFLHGYFENYASDENLDAHHWFWDAIKSGGIFIEHGVHFFDMFSGWFGEGKVIHALQMSRPNNPRKIIDRVEATVLYMDAVVNFYHGFDQPKILDRQEMRLLFARGEITLYGWIPVKIKLHGLVKDAQVAALQHMLEGCSIICNTTTPETKTVKGRSSEIHFDKEITLEYGDSGEKQDRYRQLLVDMLTDQWKWIKDRSHQRKIDAQNAVASLMIAEEATRIALTI
jgi:predicted dehydrogenase